MDAFIIESSVEIGKHDSCSTSGVCRIFTLWIANPGLHLRVGHFGWAGAHGGPRVGRQKCPRVGRAGARCKLGHKELLVTRRNSDPHGLQR